MQLLQKKVHIIMTYHITIIIIIFFDMQTT